MLRNSESVPRSSVSSTSAPPFHMQPVGNVWDTLHHSFVPQVEDVYRRWRTCCGTQSGRPGPSVSSIAVWLLCIRPIGTPHRPTQSSLVVSVYQVEDVLRNTERGPGPFVSSTAARAELPPWASTLQWWWRCRLSKWVFRCAVFACMSDYLNLGAGNVARAATLR